LHGFTINCDVFQTATNQYQYCVAIWAFIPIELNKKNNQLDLAANITHDVIKKNTGLPEEN